MATNAPIAHTKIPFDPPVAVDDYISDAPSFAGITLVADKEYSWVAAVEGKLKMYLD